MKDKTKGLQIKFGGAKTVRGVTFFPPSRKHNGHVLSIFLYQLGIGK